MGELSLAVKIKKMEFCSYPLKYACVNEEERSVGGFNFFNQLFYIERRRYWLSKFFFMEEEWRRALSQASCRGMKRNYFIFLSTIGSNYYLLYAQWKSKNIKENVALNQKDYRTIINEPPHFFLHDEPINWPVIPFHEAILIV